MSETKDDDDINTFNPMLRDGKRLAGSNTWKTFKTFLLTLFVVFPFLCTVLLPLTVFFWIIKKPLQLCQKALCCLGIREKRKRAKVVVVDDEEDVLSAAPDRTPLDDRKYDLVLFGATGFTGGLAVKYLLKQYGVQGDFKWAIAGRRLSKLEALRVRLGPAAKNLDLIIADSGKQDTLNALVNNTKVVISTVGPFQLYGTPLVQACARYGTSYCDITGEPDWVRSNIDTYDVLARETGARIVSFCGHDCIPWDLMVHKSSTLLATRGEEMDSIHIYDYVKASGSGGTLATVYESLKDQPPLKFQLDFDPMLKDQASNQNKKSSHDLQQKNQLIVGYSGENRTWVGLFFMSMVMANCIQRSNAVNKYKKNLIYSEARVHPSFMDAFCAQIFMLCFGCILFIPPLSYLVKKYGPQPGDGPTEAAMERYFLQLVGYAKGSKGSIVKSIIYFAVDPGYKDTARMLVESGLTLAVGKDLTQAGGIWTPACVMTEPLLKRLMDTGTEFKMAFTTK